MAASHVVKDFNKCKHCKKLITRYEIERHIHDEGDEYDQIYHFRFCWGCGYFSIWPNVRDEFTDSIMRNQSMIIDLIQSKELKPIL
jgi:hypothetical protein